MTSDSSPRQTVAVLWFDRQLPPEIVEWIGSRAAIVGPSPTELIDADAAVIGISQRWDATTVAGCTNLRVVSRTGIGYDNVDVASLSGVGVAVCNAPEAPSVSTAEHTLTLLFALTKRLAANEERARAGLAGPATSDALELDGRTLGLVGFGRIARRVCRAAIALGMNVVVADPFVDDQSITDAGARAVPLESLWGASDVISLHAPADPSTRHLVNAATLAQMRRGSFLVNCARGSLVDHDALVQALDGGHLGGAALDVTDPEPLPTDHPLLHHPYAIVTPHCASSTQAGRMRLFTHAIDNAIGFLTGGPCTVVAPPRADTERS